MKNYSGHPNGSCDGEHFDGLYTNRLAASHEKDKISRIQHTHSHSSTCLLRDEASRIVGTLLRITGHQFDDSIGLSRRTPDAPDLTVLSGHNGYIL